MVPVVKAATAAIAAGTGYAVPDPPGSLAQIDTLVITPAGGSTATLVTEVGVTTAITGASAGHVSLNGSRNTLYSGDAIAAKSLLSGSGIALSEVEVPGAAFTGVQG